MTPHFARSLTASFGLHAAIIGLAALLLAIGPRVTLEPKPDKIVTLLPSSYGTASPIIEARPKVVVTIPEQKPASASASPPTSVTPPPPSPRPPKPAPPKSSASSATTAPATPAHGPTMTYDEFIKQNGPPKPASPPNKPKPVTPAPQLSATAIIADITPGPQATQPTDSDFIAALVAQLQAAFMLSGPWPENLDATVSFSISADGRLRAIKVVGSSEHPAFDAAAQNACRQTRLETVPQGAAGQPYQITFRSVPRR